MGAFDAGDTGAASAHVGDRVIITGSVSSTESPCPLPFTSSKGTVYCDGFTATDGSGNNAVVSTFAYFGTSNNCGGALPDAGMGEHYTNLQGIWEDDYNSTTKVDTFVIAPTDCSDLGLSPDVNCGGGAGTGCTGTPPMSTDIYGLLSGTPTVSEVVSLHGTVTGRWSAKTGWGLVMQDSNPNAAGMDAIHVYHNSDGGQGFNGAEPNVGDYIQATGTLTQPGGKYWELSL